MNSAEVYSDFISEVTSSYCNAQFAFTIQYHMHRHTQIFVASLNN